jgi:hypothetical protein
LLVNLDKTEVTPLNLEVMEAKMAKHGCKHGRNGLDWFKYEYFVILFFKTKNNLEN